jgi:hypothetical protein
VIDRRTFLAGTGVVALVAPLAAEGQQDPKVRRIAVVRTTFPAYVEARKEGLRRLGWIEGQNIVVETPPLGDRSEAGMQEFARDLVRLKIEVIIASNNFGISAAKAATTTIPIVMVESDDPVGRGYVASLARPGGNITGQTGGVSPEINGKRVEFLAECRPGPNRSPASIGSLSCARRKAAPTGRLPIDSSHQPGAQPSVVGLPGACLHLRPFELPRREAADVDVELVQSWIVAGASELNPELQLGALHGKATDGTGSADTRPTPRAVTSGLAGRAGPAG